MNGLEQVFYTTMSRRADKKKRIVFHAPERARWVRVYPTVEGGLPMIRVGLLVCKTKVIVLHIFRFL